MSHFLVFGILRTLDTFLTQLGNGDIHWQLLFNQSGDTGLVKQVELGYCRKNHGGDGQSMLMSTYSGQPRIEGIADPVQYLEQAAILNGLDLSLYSLSPCTKDGNGIYHSADISWSESALTNILNLS